MMIWLSIAAVAAIGFLAWNLSRRLGSDHLAAFSDRRRASARLVSRGEFVDGSRRLPVALALTDSALIYENTELKASLGLEWVREIEYDTMLATGLDVRDGRVLRLRSDSQTFEFVLPVDVADRWGSLLPTRSGSEGSVRMRRVHVEGGTPWPR